MSNPRGIAFDPNGNLAVADYSYDRVISFTVVCRKYHINIYIYIILFLFS